MLNFSATFSFRALYIWAVNLSHEKFERDQISALTYIFEKTALDFAYAKSRAVFL